VARAWLAVLVALSAGSAAAAQPVQEPALPQAPPEASEQSVGPTAGAPTIDLAAAIRLALGQAFTLLDSQDAVAASRWRERTAFADFLPAVTPIYQRGEGRNVFLYEDRPEALVRRALARLRPIRQGDQDHVALVPLHVLQVLDEELLASCFRLLLEALHALVARTLKVPTMSRASGAAAAGKRFCPAMSS